MKHLKVLTCIILIIFALSQFAKSQTENIFITYTGGFSINLPQKPNGAGGNGTIGGVNFSWRQPEAEYEVGFFEIEGLPSAKINGVFSFDAMISRYFNQFSARDEKIYEKEISLQENKGREYKYKTAKSVFILRLFSAGDRIYKVLAQIPLKDQTQESKVLQIFDSFRLLDEKGVKEFMAKQLTDATPKELPQKPVAAKLKTDIGDRNLLGKVKSVLTEEAFFGSGNTMRKKHPQKYEEFDGNGRRLKEIEFDSFGNPRKVAVFGFIAGKRVSNEGYLSYDYDPGGILIESSSPLKSAKPDNRYQLSFEYKYAGNNLVEEKVFTNDGILSHRIIYTYPKGKKEIIYHDPENTPFQKTVFSIDGKGNETEVILFQNDGKKFVEYKKFAFNNYSFDSEGNWTRRTISEILEVEGEKTLMPDLIEYRTIIYYQ